jgi:hypothetical protein
MAAVLVIAVVVAAPAAQAGSVAVAPLVLMTWNLLSTPYLVSGDTLSVRCLLLRTTVPLAAVTKLRASRDFRSLRPSCWIVSKYCTTTSQCLSHRRTNGRLFKRFALISPLLRLRNLKSS